MRLTKATNYAVRALVTIARRGTVEHAGLNILAREMGAPFAFLGKVLQKLKREGILDGVRGPGGGYSLARPADDITIREVIEAMEGRTSLAVCLAREDAKSCPRARSCGARRLWSRLEERLNDVMDSETIGRLAAQRRSAARG